MRGSRGPRAIRCLALKNIMAREQPRFAGHRYKPTPLWLAWIRGCICFMNSVVLRVYCGGNENTGNREGDREKEQLTARVVHRARIDSPWKSSYSNLAVSTTDSGDRIQPPGTGTRERGLTLSVLRALARRTISDHEKHRATGESSETSRNIRIASQMDG